MPYCAGRSDGHCPLGRTGRKVHTSTVYDVQLCKDCLDYRDSQRLCKAVKEIDNFGSGEDLDQAHQGVRFDSVGSVEGDWSG